jgi:uncharacterized membrane protein YhaH (DUF805 family)
LNPIPWFLKCLKNYANFHGRARRREFWLFVLVVWIITLVVKVLTLGIDSEQTRTMISGVVALAFLLPNLAALARRMHDVGKNGWYMLIPFYNVYLAVQDSQPGANAYGRCPKEMHQ